MIPEILASYDQTLELLRRAVCDLEPEHRTVQPENVPNHPAWTIGHLVHSAEAIGMELGLESWLPESWGASFGTGSRPLPSAEAYPSLDELMQRLDEARNRLRDRLQEMGEEELACPLPDVRHRSTLPTLGHAVLHILSSHTAFHTGQIMVWRRAMRLSTEAAL